MAQDLPIVCSLGAGDLEQRLAMIGEIGAKSLLLAVAAPEAGQATADGFAMAFGLTGAEQTS